MPILYQRSGVVVAVLLCVALHDDRGTTTTAQSTSTTPTSPWRFPCVNDIDCPGAKQTCHHSDATKLLGIGSFCNCGFSTVALDRNVQASLCHIDAECCSQQCVGVTDDYPGICTGVGANGDICQPRGTDCAPACPCVGFGDFGFCDCVKNYTATPSPLVISPFKYACSVNTDCEGWHPGLTAGQSQICVSNPANDVLPGGSYCDCQLSADQENNNGKVGYCILNSDCCSDQCVDGQCVGFGGAGDVCRPGTSDCDSSCVCQKWGWLGYCRCNQN